jgi:predicted phosphodiesterase
MALFEKYGVDTYLAGHQHKCMGAQHNGIDYVIASALGRQLGNDTHGYTIVTVEDGKVAGRYVTVEEMENK